jgi:hypothetical protein
MICQIGLHTGSDDCSEEHESAYRFHDWCTRVVNQRWVIVERAIDKAMRALTSSLGFDGEWRAALTAIQAYVFERGVHDGRLVKSVGNPAVDASLIGVTTPYRLLEPHSPLMRATVACIETNLRREREGV